MKQIMIFLGVMRQWFVLRVRTVLSQIWRKFVATPLVFLARLTRLNRVFPWQYFWLIAKPYWKGKNRKKAWLLLAMTVALMVLSVNAAYYIGVTLKDFAEAINSRSSDAVFLEKGGLLLLSICVWTGAAVFCGFFRGWLIWDWRMWDSQLRIRQWITNEAFLRQQVIDLGNPDQRLIQDPDLFSEKGVLIPMMILEALYAIWTFAPLLFQNTLWLAGGCLGMAAISYVMVFLLGRRLSFFMGQRYEKEAIARTYLQGAAAQSTAIALQRNEKLVESQSLERLESLKNTLWDVLKVNRNISLWQTFWNKVVEHGPFALIGWLYLHKIVTSFGSILQGVQAFQNVYNGLTIFATNWEGISVLRAECMRIGPFVHALESINANRMPNGKWIEYRQGPWIIFRDVTVSTQYIEEKPVVVGLNLTINDSVLFAGTDGQGKPALAKAIGLGGAHGKGEITRPERQMIGFLTQTPFVPECTLRAFLSDACRESISDGEILAALRIVELPNLPEQSGGLDIVKDWKAILPLAQQQQLCLARLILSKPAYAILQEATDAFEEEYENKICSVLVALGIKIVAFSNDVRMAKHVDRVIELSPGGQAEVCKSSEYHAPRWKTFLQHLSDSRGAKEG